MDDIAQGLWDSKYALAFFAIYNALSEYIQGSEAYSSSTLLYFPTLQDVDTHIKSRVFSFLLVVVLYAIYAGALGEVSIEPHKASLENFGKGTLIGLLVIVAHTILALATGSIKIKPHKVKLRYALYVTGIFLFSMLLTSFTEELVMRGVLQDTLEEHFNEKYVIVFIAVLFGWWHLSAGVLYAIGAFVTGIVFGLLYLEHGFYMCVGLHFGHNFFESLVNSQQIIQYKNVNPLLNGDRDTPDETGILDVVIYSALAAYLYADKYGT